MRIVLDTNVLVSGLVAADGVCARILALVFGRSFRPCVDDRILAEYEDVLPRRELKIAADDVLDALRWMRDNAEAVTPLPLPCELPDVRDLPFLEVAAAAEAVLVTGNIRHFPKTARAGVTVLTPREFLDLLRQTS